MSTEDSTDQHGPENGTMGHQRREQLVQAQQLLAQAEQVRRREFFDKLDQLLAEYGLELVIEQTIVARPRR